MAAAGDSRLKLSAPSFKYLIIAGSGVVLSGVLYALYKFRQRRDLEYKDEGFVDVLKVDENSERKVLVLGLDGSGKSSILAALSHNDHDDDSPTPRPTEGFNVVCVQTGGAPLSIWEIGGAKKMRKYWTNFIQDTYILVFVVDSSDEQRLPEAFDELHKTISDERLKNTPLVLVANKQDQHNVQTPDQIKYAMGFDDSEAKRHHLHVLGTSTSRDNNQTGIKELEKLLSTLST